jgi:phage terminase large subunit-like protein
LKADLQERGTVVPYVTAAGIVGRGAGKNGYLSFEDFCLLSAANGVREYHIDTFAASEDQAKTSFEAWSPT